MFDYEKRMNELLAGGFCCSQTIAALGLELKGCEDTSEGQIIVRAMSGLCAGMGGTGNDCGALTGGVCVIGMFCGRGDKTETPHDKLHSMTTELVIWFVVEFGSSSCRELMGGDPYKKAELCPRLVKKTFEKAVQIMLENDVDI